MTKLTAWADRGCPMPVDYSREAMEQIRRLAVDGLLSLPRIGVGVGGLLLGIRRDGKISILDSMTVPCSHAEGPSFRLTPEESDRALELIRGTGPLTVVGWYCSKTRKPAALTERDLTLFGILCPKAWQLALVIRPSTVEASHVALCFRDATGLVVRGTEYPLEPFERAQAQSEPATAEARDATDAGKAAATPAVVKPTVVKPTVVKPTVVKPEIVKPEVVKRVVAGPSVRERDVIPVSRPAAEIPPATGAPPAQVPLFQFAYPPPLARRSGMKLVGWLLAASALVAGSGAAFLMRYAWMAPPLQLSASDANGHLTIRWNPGALHGIDHASLTLNDGGEPYTIPLDSQQLDAGTVGYDRKSAHVDALMQAGSLRAQVSFPQ